MAKEIHRSLEKELERRNITYTAERGRRGHTKYKLNLDDGRRRLFVCSYSPSDHRAAKNNLALLRRILAGEQR